MSVATLAYRITADSTSFGREMRFAERDVRRLQRRAESDIRKISKAFGIMGAAVATAVGAMVVQHTRWAAEVGVASEKTGIAVEELSNMAYAARENEVDFDTLGKRLERFNTQIVEAAQGNGDLVDVLREQNIALEDDSGIRAQRDLLHDLADAVQGAGSEYERTRIAQAAFGRRGGAEMLPFLRQGSDAIAELEREAERLGLTIDTNTSNAARELEANMRAVRDMGTSWSNQIVSQTLPSLVNYSSSLLDMTNRKKDVRSEGVTLQKFFQGLLLTFELVRVGAVLSAEGLKALGQQVVETGKAFVGNIMEQGRLLGDSIFDMVHGTTHAARRLAAQESGEIESAWEGHGERSAAIWDDFEDRKQDIVKQSWMNIDAILTENLAHVEDKTGELDGVAEGVSPFSNMADEAEEAAERIMREADRIVGRFETNQERFTRQMNILGEALELGHIELEEFYRAWQGLEEELDPFGAFAEAERLADMQDMADQVIAEINGVDLAHEAHLESLAELHDEGLITWEQYRLAVEMAKGETEELADATAGVQQEASALFDFVQSGAEVLADQLIDAIVDPFNVSLEDMAANFSQTLARMALELAAQQALLAVFGGGAGGIGGALAFAGGGYVSGPGGPTSDSIPAYLSDGEYVLRANATQSIGPSTLDFMNRTGKIPGYASGGLVGGRPAGDHGTTPNIKILNIPGQNPEDFMRSKAGEQVIVNTMMKYADRMSQ